MTIKQNQYSVPVRLVGRRVSARLGARELEISADGQVVARHVRLDGRFETTVRLDHYLELLKHKPGALSRSLALRQERERGAWPDCYDELWQRIAAKVSASEAARQIVDVLLLCREHGADRVELAVRGALAAGAYDGRAVALLAARAERPAPAPLEGLDARLARLERPVPDLAEYDRPAAQQPGGVAVSFEPVYDIACAHLDEQQTLLGDYDLVQFITLQLSDQFAELEPVQAELTSKEARDLAFRLLVLAEHADRRSEGLA